MVITCSGKLFDQPEVIDTSRTFSMQNGVSRLLHPVIAPVTFASYVSLFLATPMKMMVTDGRSHQNKVWRLPEVTLLILVFLFNRSVTKTTAFFVATFTLLPRFDLQSRLKCSHFLHVWHFTWIETSSESCFLLVRSGKVWNKKKTASALLIFASAVVSSWIRSANAIRWAHMNFPSSSLRRLNWFRNRLWVPIDFLTKVFSSTDGLVGSNVATVCRRSWVQTLACPFAPTL